jgi:hypothetical protein
MKWCNIMPSSRKVSAAETWRACPEVLAEGDLVSRSLLTITGFVIVPDRSSITQLPNYLLTQ